ncbi:unnamed protein product [Alopecurus aequalis]
MDASEGKPTPPGASSPARAPAPVTPWSTGLFDCMEDQGNCCLTCMCPCITFGLTAEIVDRGATSSGASAALYMLLRALMGCQLQWVYSWVYRTKMRAQYGLEETPCPDCCVACFCEPCAACQQFRELRNRGYVMDIGWHANMEMQGRGGGLATVPPPMHAEGMTR